jgi:hypothetical protein
MFRSVYIGTTWFLITQRLLNNTFDFTLSPNGDLTQS